MVYLHRCSAIFYHHHRCRDRFSFFPSFFHLFLSTEITTCHCSDRRQQVTLNKNGWDSQSILQDSYRWNNYHWCSYINYQKGLNVHRGGCTQDSLYPQVPSHFPLNMRRRIQIHKTKLISNVSKMGMKLNFHRST